MSLTLVKLVVGATPRQVRLNVYQQSLVKINEFSLLELIVLVRYFTDVEIEASFFDK